MRKGSGRRGRARKQQRQIPSSSARSSARSVKKRRRKQASNPNDAPPGPASAEASGKVQPAALIALAAVLVVGAVLGFLVVNSGGKQRKPVAQNGPPRAAGQEENAGDHRPPHPGWVKVGGVWRPGTDVAENGTGPKTAPVSTKTGNDATTAGTTAGNRPSLGDPGRSELIPLDANPHVKSVAAAFASANHAERLTSFVRPKPFDRQAFLADPKSYLETIEPGRVYQSAQPGENVKRIKRLSTRYQSVVQGETVTFRVEVEPNMPVSFHSTRLGRFSNKLSTQTVKANADGIAEVQFTATPGTRGDIDVLAASPTSSHQARFVVHVTLPKGPPDVKQ